MTQQVKANGSGRKELFSQITQALSEISDLARQVFVLAHYRGLSDSRIAAELGIRTREIPLLRKYAEERICQKLVPSIPSRICAEPGSHNHKAGSHVDKTASLSVA